MSQDCCLHFKSEPFKQLCIPQACSSFAWLVGPSGLFQSLVRSVNDLLVTGFLLIHHSISAGNRASLTLNIPSLRGVFDQVSEISMNKQPFPTFTPLQSFVSSLSHLMFTPQRKNIKQPFGFFPPGIKGVHRH